MAFKMIAMMETPDHATIARFVARHEAALAELFGQVLRLCAEAGLVRPGVVAIDGTRMAGNASRESTRDFEEIAREILAEAKATDEAEDELYGDERGDELPEQLRTREGRAEFFRQAREQRAAETASIDEPELVPEPAEDRQEGSSSTSSGSWRATRDARVGRGKHAASSSSAAGSNRIPFPARARIGCCSRASGWRPSVTRRSRPTGRMRITGRTVATRTAGRLGRAPERRGSRRRCPRGW